MRPQTQQSPPASFDILASLLTFTTAVYSRKERVFVEKSTGQHFADFLSYQIITVSIVLLLPHVSDLDLLLCVPLEQRVSSLSPVDACFVTKREKTHTPEMRTTFVTETSIYGHFRFAEVKEPDRGIEQEKGSWEAGRLEKREGRGSRRGKRG